MVTQSVRPYGYDFAYRKNSDGKFDSICLYCFATVASANSIEELAGREFLHSFACSWKKPPQSVRYFEKFVEELNNAAVVFNF